VQFHKFKDVPNVDALTQNLTKAFYTIRVVKTRDYKIKLLSVVNYFRAIQRILALDVREFMTREKAMGDKIDMIEPHFGYTADGKEIIKTI
jgi:isopenicillin N synthase-like dioxygenase